MTVGINDVDLLLGYGKLPRGQRILQRTVAFVAYPWPFQLQHLRSMLPDSRAESVPKGRVTHKSHCPNCKLIPRSRFIYPLAA